MKDKKEGNNLSMASAHVTSSEDRSSLADQKMQRNSLVRLVDPSFEISYDSILAYSPRIDEEVQPKVQRRRRSSSSASREWPSLDRLSFTPPANNSSAFANKSPLVFAQSPFGSLSLCRISDSFEKLNKNQPPDIKPKHVKELLPLSFWSKFKEGLHSPPFERDKILEDSFLIDEWNAQLDGEESSISEVPHSLSFASLEDESLGDPILPLLRFSSSSKSKIHVNTASLLDPPKALSGPSIDGGYDSLAPLSKSPAPPGKSMASASRHSSDDISLKAPAPKRLPEKSLPCVSSKSLQTMGRVDLVAGRFFHFDRNPDCLQERRSIKSQNTSGALLAPGSHLTRRQTDRGFQDENGLALAFDDPHKMLQTQQPLHSGPLYKECPETGLLHSPHEYQSPPKEALFRSPNRHSQILSPYPHSDNPLPTAMSPPVGYSPPSYQAFANNSLQESGLQRDPGQPRPPSYPNQHAQDLQSSLPAAPDNFGTAYLGFNPAPPYPQESREGTNQARNDKRAESQQSSATDQQNRISVRTALLYSLSRHSDTNPSNLSFEAAHGIQSSHTIKSSLNQLPDSVDNESFSDNRNRSLNSNILLKGLKNHDNSMNQPLQPGVGEASRLVAAVFPRLAFNPANIIHFIQYLKPFENGWAAEKSLVSDSELSRLLSLISKEGSEPIARSSETEGPSIDFEKLASIKVRLVGACGRSKAMFQALADNGLIAHNETELYVTHFAERGSGLYLLPIVKSPADTLILLVLYSNDDRDFDKVDEKHSYTRLLRYLTQLCSFNILAINQRDVELIASKEDIEPTMPSCYKLKTNKLFNDNCELTEGKIIDPIAGSKTLIATSSRCGFYTKSSHPSKTEITKGVYQWKDKDDYDRAFQGCVVHADKLDALETEVMHNFLHQHFPAELKTVHDLLPQELDRVLAESKAQIDFDVRQGIKLHITQIAVKCMELTGMPEHDWLKKAVEQPQFLSAKKSARIRKCFETDFKLHAEDQSKFSAMHEKITLGKFFRTEIIAMRQIVDACTALRLSKSHELIIIRLKEQIGAPENRDSKQALHRAVIDYLNAEKRSNGKYVTPWTYETLVTETRSLRSTKAFLNENFELCIKDARRMFKLLYRKARKDLDVKRVKAEVREQLNGQFESALKKKLFLQATKDCLERDEGKAVVRITALKEPTTAGSFQLEYTKEDITEALNEYSVSQYEIGETDLGHTKVEDCNIECPASKPLTTFRLPASNELVKMMFVNEHSLAVAVNSQGHSQIMLYSTTGDSKVHRLPLFDQAIHTMDYNDSTSKFALYTGNEKESVLRVFRAGKNFSFTNGATINLNDEFGITGVRCLCLGNKSEVFLVDGRGTLWNVDYASKSAEPLTTRIKDIKSILLVPGAHCLLLVTSTNVVPYIIETDKVLPRILLSTGTKLDNFVITKLGSQIRLLLECEGKFFSSQLKCELSRESCKLEKYAPGVNQAKCESLRQRSIFDYLGSLYNYYPACNLMEDLSRQSIEQKLVVYCSHTKTHSKDDEETIKDKLAEIQMDIKKPKCESLKLAESAVFILPGENHSQLLYSQSSAKSLERWIQELISLVPIQIGRTENNQYIILNDEKPLQTSDTHNVYEVKEKISYGFIEAILSNWHKPVKVISSMGKQRTGKSCTLNNLFGSNFAAEAAPRTEGCWLTVKITDEGLYVLMSFEGLGNAESREQEQTLFWAQSMALSSVTLYETGGNLGKEIDQALYRLNQGAIMLKDDDRLFQGRFLWVVRDVDPQDASEVMSTIRWKTAEIIKTGERKDFITRMYNGRFAINVLSSITHQEYDYQIQRLAEWIHSHARPVFASGKDFLNLMKTVQAKLAIRDFTSLGRQDTDARVFEPKT